MKAYEKEEQIEADQKPSTFWRDEKTKREHERLQQQAFEFWNAQHERFKRLAKGPESFPLDKQLEEIEREYPTSSYHSNMDQLIEGLGLEKYSQEASRLRSTIALCNVHLQSLRKREACEIVIWDKLLSETLGEIEFFEGKKQRKVERVRDLSVVKGGSAPDKLG